MSCRAEGLALGVVSSQGQCPATSGTLPTCWPSPPHSCPQNSACVKVAACRDGALHILVLSASFHVPTELGLSSLT